MNLLGVRHARPQVLEFFRHVDPSGSGHADPGRGADGAFPKNTWELAYQIQHVEYEESGLKEETGWMHGVAGGYQTRVGDSALLWLEAAVLSGNRTWRMGGRAEYDLFLRGQATSHLGDAVANWDTVENDQNYGWGMRASIFAERAVGKDWSLVVEPFFRYRDIAKSVEAGLTSGGRIIGRAREPANTTTAWGLRLGAKS